MKYLFSALLVACSILAFGQKDKTSDWKVPLVVEGTITLTTKSKPLDKNYYQGFDIMPKVAQPLRITAWCRNSSFIFQVTSKKTQFVNELVASQKTFTIPLTNTDTLSVFFIAKPTERINVDMGYKYTIGDTTYTADTAQVILSKDPQIAFEQLLKMASSQFVTLYPSTTKSYEYKDLEFPGGLYFPKRAFKDGYGVTQYTSITTDSTAAAKDVKDWNKKVKSWLKEYKVTDVKSYTKAELRAKSDYLNDEATVYKKTNTAGVVLFTVTVFTRNDSGNAYTGINIDHR